MTLRSFSSSLVLPLLLALGACASSTTGEGERFNGGSSSGSGTTPGPGGEGCLSACKRFGGACGARCDAACSEAGCAAMTNPDDVVGIACEPSSLTFYYASQNTFQCTAAGAGTPREAQGEAATAKRLFITSTDVDGDLRSAGGAATGLAGGDALCQQHAEAAELGGTWKAWLSDSTTAAIDRIDDVGPWYNVDRSAVLFKNKATLATKPYDTFGALLMDESGKAGGIASSRKAWSGTESGGRAAEYVCGDWTSTGLSSYGEYLTPTFAGGWNNGSFQECYAKTALICVEQ